MSQTHTAQDYLKKLPDFQKKAVEKLLDQNKPFKPTPSVLKQWLVWLGFSVIVVALAMTLIGPQMDLWDRVMDPASGSFLFLAFLGSALAAWGGIASSMPGSEPGSRQKILIAAILLFLFAMPFFFFEKDDWSSMWSHNVSSDWFCFKTVLVIALPSWILLGWMVSRNASFHPGWTGTWLGISAFLLGTGTIQTHCAHWERCHMLVDHLMPMAIFIFLPIWIGSFWFSRWKK